MKDQLIKLHDEFVDKGEGKICLGALCMERNKAMNAL